MKFAPLYKIPKVLLTTENSKTVKGEKLGYTTYIMYLSPHTQNSKGVNLCAKASPGCAKACLHKSGAARFDPVQKGKLNKTEYFLADRKTFMRQLSTELTKIQIKHDAIIGNKKDIGTKGKVLFKKFAVRLNGTSDFPFENLRLFRVVNGKIWVYDKPKKYLKNIFELFPNIQFYDYTKLDQRFDKVLPLNYNLTFSRSEINDVESLDLLNRGYNVAYVFGIKDVKDFPKTYNGFEVINGDDSDLRFLDKENVIVGLKYKLTTIKGSAGVNKDNLENNDFLIKVEKLELAK
jgi:hypothetical protein